jgi:glycosyltransferase involved in cell wall biosynthesis
MSPPYRLCHVTESDEPGGAESVILRLVEEYGRRGIPQRFVLMREGWLASELRGRGLSPVVLPSGGSLDLRWILSFARFLRGARIDLVHSHLLDANCYASIAAAVARVPCVVTEHGDVTMSAKSSWKHTLKLLATQLAADRVIVVSERTRTALLRRAPIGAGRTTVIYNGIRADEYRQGPAAPVRSSLGIPSDARVVGTVGALTGVKGHETLLRAHAGLPDDTWCLIVGEGPMRQGLEMLSVELGTRARVIFTGFRNDVPSVLRAMDVFCLPSLSEGLPLVLIEALASGLPIVASDVGGIREVLSRCGGGRLVPPSDPGELERSLRTTLAAKPAEVKFPPEFELDGMVDSYLRLYTEVLPEGKS